MARDTTKTPVTFKMEPDRKQELEELAWEQKTSVSALVREWVQDELAEGDE